MVFLNFPFVRSKKLFVFQYNSHWISNEAFNFDWLLEMLNWRQWLVLCSSSCSEAELHCLAVRYHKDEYWKVYQTVEREPKSFPNDAWYVIKIIYWLLFMIRIYIQTQNKPINDSDLYIRKLAYTVYNKTPDYLSNLLEPPFYIWP